ncbi:29729_t:CDS:2 [Gigaspora margarita]|uniref:29729_t:CDS:1 n=1 Tax=Gigaspora margarita TaxID=4874 RepID=A0ABN7UHZ6_GIGMA|nr:29729_t:CDS:2 [Gigaspora margarita]
MQVRVWNQMSNDGPIEPHKSKKGFEFIKQDEVVDLFKPIADIYNKAEIVMRNKFEKAVDALRCPNPIEKLKNVCNEYGAFWAREIVIGGKIQNINAKNINSNLQSNKMGTKRIDINDKESTVKSMNICGDTNLARENINEWIKSLENSAKLRIV